MANSLFIGYELDKPDRDYTDLIRVIKELGGWAHVKTSFWYLTTTLDAQSVFNRLQHQLQPQDKLIVIDPTRNYGIWAGLDAEVSNYLKANWR